MKRYTLALVVATGLVLCSTLENASANPPKSGGRSPSPAPGHSHTPYGHNHGGRPLPPVTYVTPRSQPPVVIVPAPPVAVAPAAPAVGGGELTRGAWVGYNITTGRYSVAFDSPGVGGMSILLQNGFSMILQGPTDWNTAVSYLKSVGAPGW